MSVALKKLRIAEEEVEALKAQLTAVTRERDEAVNQLKEINGCLDWGAIASGRATTLSEVQRTISVLRETQHGRDQDRIKHEMERDQLRAELATLRDGWISVTERLPEKAVSVLGYIQGGGGEPYACTIRAGVIRNMLKMDSTHAKPTHWKPLPAPPTDGRAE